MRVQAIFGWGCDVKMETILNILKNIPFVDFGQGNMRHKTKAKQIAFKYAEKNIKNNATALDLGCGDGYWSERLKQLGYDVISTDIEKCHKDAQVVDANYPLPYPDKNFDLVWSMDVIEHLENPDFTAQEIKRVLKSNGTAILITSNSYFWLYYFFKIFGLTPRDLQRRDHKYFFCFKDIQKLFPKSEIYGYFPYTILKFKIKNSFLIKVLSPTFVIIDGK